MNLSLLLDEVIPESGVLAKINHSYWVYYKTESDFIHDRYGIDQLQDESFEAFAERLVKQIMEDEECCDEKTVTINYAIWSNRNPTLVDGESCLKK